MAITFDFYLDSGLTTPLSSGNPIAATFAGAGSTDVQVWFGSTATDTEIQTATSPGTNPIEVIPTDANGGSGQATSALKLATSQAGLDSATAGATLQIGTSVQSGVANAYPFWLRITNAVTTPGEDNDLSLATNSLLESPV